MTYFDWVEIQAHYALADPKKALENEIDFEATRAQILRDREAAKQQQ